MKTLRLGLIGGNITESRSPALQIACGLSVRLNVSYDLLIPHEQGISFADMLKRCEAAGFDGVNVTYPYKADVLKYVVAGNGVVAALGASNTVRFSQNGTTAWNTDYSGFIAAFRARFGTRTPGRVLQIGAGGVGRAIAFALKELGADDIILYDIDAKKAEPLAAATGARLANASQMSDLSGLDGVVNCTPLGMVGREGSPLPASVNGKPKWAFDAVYTPEHTVFRTQMELLGADFMSGDELYFYQGIQGFKIFSGRDVVNQNWVRQTLRFEI